VRGLSNLANANRAAEIGKGGQIGWKGKGPNEGVRKKRRAEGWEGHLQPRNPGVSRGQVVTMEVCGGEACKMHYDKGRLSVGDYPNIRKS